MFYAVGAVVRPTTAAPAPIPSPQIASSIPLFGPAPAPVPTPPNWAEYSTQHLYGDWTQHSDVNIGYEAPGNERGLATTTTAAVGGGSAPEAPDEVNIQISLIE